MFHKVKSVVPMQELKLLLEFQDDTKKIYDIKPLLKKWPAFQALYSVPKLFEQVHVDAGGYAVIWNDDIDLSCDELYDNSLSCDTDGDLKNTYSK